MGRALMQNYWSFKKDIQLRLTAVKKQGDIYEEKKVAIGEKTR